MNNQEGKKPFYITTTLPYVNSAPHIGFALEIVRADAIARFYRLMGHDVFFNTGTDEHGTKIYQKALELGKNPKEYTDEMSEHFKSLKDLLNLSYDKFIRTTYAHHEEAAQEFWKRCDKAGYIYKKKYSGLYCVGCEMFLQEKDLVNGECPHHPGKKLNMLEEENYFFKFSAFTDVIKKYFNENKDFVIPESRANEMKAYLERGLEDFSISRLKEKMPWGVPVPGDDEQVMYVWFDALVNYVSTLGWPEDEKGLFEKFWVNGTVVQICGKDNTQHQSLRWQAMLNSIDLPFSRHILVNGFINVDGQKMSKTLGNVIDPVDLVKEYGTDAVRYFFLRELNPNEDSDFTFDKMKETYNANLANGLGNLASRIMKMAEDNLESAPEIPEESIPQEYKDFMYAFEYQKAMDFTWKKIGDLDTRIQKEEPFKLVKVNKEEAIEIIKQLAVELYTIGRMLYPFMPETNVKIKEMVKANKKPAEPLFARKD